jgi:hypothetical protein|tara:strand:+ start:111 stop:1091 length:981 start_codon:yes stop_codon:yes gene_type:complete
MNTDAGQVTKDDITIDSNHETVDQIQLAFADSTAVEESKDETPSSDTPVETVAAQESQSESPDSDESIEAKNDLSEKKSKNKGNRRNNPTEAVKSAVAKQREAERRAEAAEARVQQMTAPPQPDPPPQNQTPDWERYKSLPGVPTVDQFQNYEDYSMAMSSFISDVRYQEREIQKSSAEQARQQQERDSAQLSQWNDRLTKARSSNPEFDESLNLDTPMSLPMQHLAMESPQGIEILQWLSANPKESQRISTLHPAETYREMGKIEARLEAAPPRASARAVSNAKPPIRPLGTSPHVADEFAITDDLSFDEHFRRANAADRARGRL